MNNLNNQQQPSTSSGSSNNGSSNNQNASSQNADITKNARFNCSKCQQHSLIPNKPVYYLPCLHILCNECFDRLKSAQNNNHSIFCPACRRDTLRECIFDDFTYDKNRKQCENEGCENKTEESVFSFCKTCNKYLCESCATKHEDTHMLKDASTYIPLSSRCSTQHTPNRFAAFVCSCRRYLCVNCSHTHRCERTGLTNVSSLIEQSIGYMTKVAENDRRIYNQYSKNIENIQNRRRQIIAEFHNARSSLAHNVTKTTSLLIHRFNDIREHLNVLQNTLLNQLGTHEKMVTMEMQRLKDVIGLENQIKTTKEHNAIPFFSFVKAASSIALNSCKHQNYNVDQQIPMLNIKVDTKLVDFCNFLNTFGTVTMNSTPTRPKSKFDNSVVPMFDAVPKINPTNIAKSFGYDLRVLDGKKHVVVDQEEIRRKVKRIQDPEELRERCEQLENELVYYKTLASHLESELQNKRLPEIPTTSKTSSSQSSSQPHLSNHQSNRPNNLTSSQQQQIIQQLKNHPSLHNMNLPANIQRLPNHHGSRRGGHHPHDSGMHHHHMGHPRLPPNAPFPNHNLHNSMPGSPQLNAPNHGRHPSNSVHSPLTPNSIIPPNVLFARPPHITPQDWQMHCMQYFRNRAPNPQQLNTCLNELMRNSMASAQLSPTAAMANPLQNHARMQTPPSNPMSVGSRAGSISGAIDATRYSREDSEPRTRGATATVEVINLSDDEEATHNQQSSSQQATNGKSASLKVKFPNVENASIKNPLSNTSSINENTETATPQSDAFSKSFRFLSDENSTQENKEKSARASSVPQTNNVPIVEQTPTTSQTNQGSKSEERPSHETTENQSSHPPIKLKFLLGERKLPSVIAKDQADNGENVSKGANEADSWDDFCFLCNEGCDETSGELGCCSTCPRVFHQYCHVPACTKPMADLPDDWRCGICIEVQPIQELLNDFSEKAVVACSRVLLLCYQDSQKVEPFRRAEFSKESETHISLNKIATRISKRAYSKISDFINDMNTLFMNCSKYNAPNSEIAEFGRSLYRIYQDAVREFLPAYVKKLWMYVTLFINKSGEVPKKKRKLMD